MDKPLILNTDHLRPLDRKEWDGPCMSCGKKQARWMFKPANRDGAVSICSLCWLYESVWGQNRREEIFKYVRAVEEEIGTAFLKDKGRLIRVQDADRLLGALALESRMFQLQASK
jgi:hypothetical protein